MKNALTKVSFTTDGHTAMILAQLLTALKIKFTLDHAFADVVEEDPVSGIVSSDSAGYSSYRQGNFAAKKVIMDHLKKLPQLPSAFHKAFEDHGFSPTTARPTLSKMFHAGEIQRTKDRPYRYMKK